MQNILHMRVTTSQVTFNILTGHLAPVRVPTGTQNMTNLQKIFSTSLSSLKSFETHFIVKVGYIFVGVKVDASSIWRILYKKIIVYVVAY